MFACTKVMEHVKNANIHLKYYSRNKLLIIIVTPMYTQPESYYYYYYFRFCDVTLAIIHKEKSIKIFLCCGDLLENVYKQGDFKENFSKISKILKKDNIKMNIIILRNFFA
jgi:hypothetical protein